MINLESADDQKKLEKIIKSDIDLYCLSKYDQGHRDHLGASELGKPCSRQLYYKFRWCNSDNFDGRMLRLFNVGHSAEPRFIDYLRGIGFEVKEFDTNGKQFRISGVMGHYGGSLDGMCKAPARYEITENLIFLNEFKTNGTGVGYNKVSEQPLYKAKPQHFDQMCQYGYHYKLKYGIYLIENKNDSDITIKIVPLDWQRGAELERRAADIITSQEPPTKISDNPSYYECRYCTFKGICHEGEMPQKNCRSCRLCKPVENSNWHCSRYNANIPKEWIPVGCNMWCPL